MLVHIETAQIRWLQQLVEQPQIGSGAAADVEDGAAPRYGEPRAAHDPRQ
jgi:hypothetical protein